MAASGFGHLGLDERRSLFRLREARVPVAEIAFRLGRHRSTVYRELARNRYRDRENAGDRRYDVSGYYPVTAQDQALARRHRLAKLARRKKLLAHVVDRLCAGWSPQQIAGPAQIASRFRWLRLDGASGADGKAMGRLCHETIYRHVYGPEGRTEQLHLCLPRARRRRAARHGRKPRGHRIPLARGIACRPAEVATRDSFGHWEGDLLIFARNGGPANVTTLLERRSRFLVLLANPAKSPLGDLRGTADRQGSPGVSARR